MTKLSPDAVAFLKSCAWFTALPPEQQTLAVRSSIEKIGTPGEIIARAGEPCLHWYGLIRGFLQMYLAGPDGNDTTLYCMREGEWGGDGSLLKKEMRRYDLRSLTPTHVLLMPVTTFETLRNQSLPFNHFLCDTMNQRMGMFVGMLAASRLSGADMQFANALLMLASNATSSALEIEIPQHELALISGLSRQRVNTAVSSFIRSEILRGEPRKGLLVVNVSRLKAYVSARAA